MIYEKCTVFDHVWQYSRYYGNLLISCENISKEKYIHGHASLIYLFNILENIIKSQVHDYDARFVDAIKKLKLENYINDIEYDFLNNSNYGIRKIKNLLAHENLSRYNIVFLSEDKELLFPLTENKTSIKIYYLTSKIIFNLILKIISSNSILPIDVDIDTEIKNFNIEIKEISAEQLLEYKDIDYKTLKGWSQMPEVEQYRMAENSSDVNHYVKLFKKIVF